jgi:SAM-dependent methyltransferase
MTHMRGARSWARRARDFTYYFGLLPPGRHGWRHLPRFLRDARAYRRASARATSFPFMWAEAQPMLTDYAASAGSASGHYFHQDLWAARRIYAVRPTSHVDIGSRVDGFVAHVLTFMPVTVLDIRPLESDVRGLTFVPGDVCHLTGFASDSVESLSCLHAVEHIGLGRYGDAIAPDGWRTALNECSRVLAPGGRFYLGTPVGRERLNFNSGRVFSPLTIIAAVPALRLISFSAVNDAGHLVEPADPATFADAEYSCGLFEFAKP